MIGSRAWYALMRRNVIYRKRHWLSTIFELALPFCFVWILVALKNASGIDNDEKNPKQPALYPEDYRGALIPFSYEDYMKVFMSSRVCSTNRDESLDITGFHEGGYNWQMPFVRCDPRLCQFLGQDAQSFCEYSMLAVAASDKDDIGGRIRAQEFATYVYRRWPQAMRRRTGNQTSGMPFDFPFVQLFHTPDKMDEYVKRHDYGTPGVPKIGIGIVFDGNDQSNYKYWIRQNTTLMNAVTRESEGQPVHISTPPTNRLFNDYARNDVTTCYRSRRAPRIGKYQDSCTALYMYNGVIATQRLVGDFILWNTGAAAKGYFVSDGGVSYVQFPQHPYFSGGFYATFDQFTGLLLSLGLLYPVAAMISYIVLEKQWRQKELMKMMSVTEPDIGWSWFTSFAIFHLFSATFAALVSTILYQHSSFHLLWIFWALTFLAIVVYSMAMSTVSSKTPRSVLIGILVFFLGVFLTIVVDAGSGDNSALVTVINLHPVAAFAYGIKRIGLLEDFDQGLTSDTIGYTEGSSDYSINTTLFFLGLDSVVWGIISWYLNRVVPLDYGQGLPFWFLFDPAYWFPSRFAREDMDMGDSGRRSSRRRQAHAGIPFEPVGDAFKRQASQVHCVQIDNLSKTYGKTIAVDNLSLSMYNGHITALLGHNGAGKTTTINMLTGASAPSSGTAYVSGRDIRHEMDKIRKDIGICLQHDCLFPNLTVKEHIQFFARLKGLYSQFSSDEVERQVEQSIQDVALQEKSNTLSKNLSGGMKRKLSVAIAFCGGSSVVLLDEPTSGMDPFSRRFTWDVIRQYRHDRCIILTTHFMDEADILGDRIAIMSEGQLRCAGSPLFLKKTYGVGYQLTIEKARDSPLNSVSPRSKEAMLDSMEKGKSPTTGGKKLKRMVTKAVPNASLLTDVGYELTYQLPLSSSPRFVKLFERLDEQVEGGLISCYGVSVTTLNEVFLLVTRGQSPAVSVKTTKSSKVAGVPQIELRPNQTAETMLSSEAEDCSVEQSLSKYESSDEESKRGTDREATERLEDDSSEKCQKLSVVLENNRLFSRHLVALLKKRAAYFRRDKKAWACTAIVPSLFVLVGFMVFALSAAIREMSPLTLDLDDYNVGHKIQQNPIAFNSPANPYLCQPGICSHRQPYVEQRLTNERYVFCGMESKLGIDTNRKAYDPTNETCSLSSSSDIMNSITEAGVVLDQGGVQNVSESSLYLLDFSQTGEFIKYGAVWFTHEEGSIMNDKRQYNTTVIAQCNIARQLLNYTGDCDRFGGVGYVIQYNFTAIHSALLFESLANKALVRHATEDPDFEVEATIAPLLLTDEEEQIGKADDAYAAWFLVMLSFPFITGAYGSFVVSEKVSKAKHLQTVAGVEPSAYWLSTWIWDVFNYQFPLWVTVVLMFAFDVDILTTSERGVFSGILAILCLFGPASAGFTYCISFAFKSSAMCNIFMIISGFIIGFGGTLTCHILTTLETLPNIPELGLANVANILAWILRPTPYFCLGRGLFNAINIDTLMYIERIQNDDEDFTAWTEPILLYEVYFLAAQCFVYLVLAILLDRWSSNPRMLSLWRSFLRCVTFTWLRKSFSKSEDDQTLPPLPDDEDVVAERDLVLSGEADRDLIVIKELRKVYDDGKVAVDGMTLGISPGECFGLLGINGAGKTTTMGMLTAEFPPTSGDAILGGVSVTKEPEKIRRRIGYCPQFDAHFTNLTGREHVELYASIKGIPAGQVAKAAQQKLKEVGLSSEDRDRLCSEYSGGMKRRLSLACATIGNPQIIFLDECSTGVDPVARREIWQLVNGIVAGRGLSADDKPSVVLTTHSMDECEALCPRIGIMANGKLRCLGSAQRLKSKFGQGYQVELQIRNVDRSDEDYQKMVDTLQRLKPSNATKKSLFFNLEECKICLFRLSGDNRLSDLISDQNGPGYVIWKDATSPSGVSVENLAVFATSESRVEKVGKFVVDKFPKATLREQQDTKLRYEVSNEGIKISTIFGRIEANKKELCLADYSVSQTSLEQVFLQHAKKGRVGLARITV